MEKDFWHERWRSNKIAFHESETNQHLIRYFDQLALMTNSRVMIPLCGKSLDLHWILSKGYQVVGIELVEQAVDDFFTTMKVAPKVQKVGAFKHYSFDKLEIFQGDIFDMTTQILGKVDAIYDRAALVALPLEIRRRYSQCLVQLSQKAPQLLITFEYDQSLMDGPPFSIPDPEVFEHYSNLYQVKLLEELQLKEGLKGVSAVEKIWKLS